MSEKNNGGPAFPAIDRLDKSTDGFPHYDVVGAEGMTLRDYFAAKALPALIARVGSDIDMQGRYEALNEGLAITAYELADAMLKARDE